MYYDLYNPYQKRDSYETIQFISETAHFSAKAREFYKNRAMTDNK